MKKLVIILLLFISSAFAGWSAWTSPLIETVIDKSDFTPEIRNLKREAKAGDANAAFELGGIYKNREDHDYERARTWYEKAANNGHLVAKERLGDMYRYGLGVEKDWSQAKIWYEKAANNGHIPSQFMMGELYRYGNGVKQNWNQAKFWYEKAANQDHGTAQFTLGYMYHGGLGVEQNNEKSVAWYKEASKNGISAASYNLGQYYLDKPSGRDYAQAKFWYEKARDQGQTGVSRGLAIIRMETARSAKEYLDAGVLHNQALHDVNSSGIAEALESYTRQCENLTVFKGQKTPSSQKAYCHVAAGAGITRAQTMLSILYFYGKGLPKDNCQALAWALVGNDEPHLTCKRDEFSVKASRAKQASFGMIMNDKAKLIQCMELADEYHKKYGGYDPQETIKDLNPDRVHAIVCTKNLD